METTHIKLDLSRHGLGIVFKPYMVIAINKLWLDQAGISEGYNSKRMHTEINAEGDSISRASIINGLNWLVDVGIVGYEEKSGKGGYHRIYRILMTREELWKWIASKTTQKLVGASGLSIEDLLNGYKFFSFEEEEEKPLPLEHFTQIEE